MQIFHPAKFEPALTLARSDWQKRHVDEDAIAHGSEAHHLREIDTIPEEAGARRSICALDRIHAHDKVSPILHRYHLVQLVRRRDELQQKLNGTTRQQEPVVLKYGLRRQPPAKALIGPKDAAGKALRELMKEAYPEDLPGKGEESAQYDQRFKELKN
jgi:hypothetical protein